MLDWPQNHGVVKTNININEKHGCLYAVYFDVHIVIGVIEPSGIRIPVNLPPTPRARVGGQTVPSTLEKGSCEGAGNDGNARGYHLTPCT
jgi:hypothetical protein